MMRVLVFCTAVCVLNVGVRCLPLLDDKGAGECDTADVSMSPNMNGPGTDCTVVESDDVLNTEQRHKALLRELQQLAEQERERKSEQGYARDDYKHKDTVRDEDEEWEEDDEDEEDEAVMEKNERDLEELLEMRETQRTADEEKRQQMEERSTELELMMEVKKVEKELKQLLEMNDTQTWNREQEKQQKQEELQELLRKMSRVQEEDRSRSHGQTDKRETPQKREMEKASDEATRQFERERQSEEEEDEDEELLEIEAELRKVAAELRELRSA